jgi:hypothetical protein
MVMSGRAVFKVLLPIPEIGAEPGDFLCAEPSQPNFPLTLTRHFDRNYLPIVLDDQRLTQVWSDRPRLELVR